MKKILLILLALPMIGLGQNINKKMILASNSSFSFQNSFENDKFNASSNILLNGSFGYRLTNSFLVGGNVSFTSMQANSISSQVFMFGPFIRAYLNDAYFFFAFEMSGNNNTSGSVYENPTASPSIKTGFGYQVFLNEFVSLNPNITLYNNKYGQIGPDYYQTGILLGFGFELHL